MKTTAKQKKLRPKKCRSSGCDNTFTPWNSTQVACSHTCALALVAEKKEKARKKETREMRKAFNDKDRSHLAKKAEESCNRYIRERDRWEGCISCGIREGKMQAGHFYSVGHAPEIRYHPDNIHLQCAQCNHYKSGNANAMLIGMEKKIGRDRIDNLTRNRNPQNLTTDDLKEIKEWYDERYKWLIKEREIYTIA